MSMFDLSGAVCVVTGATKGIGRETALRLAEHGGRVVVTSRSLADAETAAAEIERRAGAGRALPVAYDIMDATAPETLMQTVVAHFGRMDHLVANAAHIEFGRILQTDDVQTRRSLEANVVAQVALARSALPHITQAQAGSLTFITSSLGLMASPTYLSYSLAKAALSHLVRILAVEFGERGVRVNGIAPGPIATEGTSFVQDNAAATAALVGGIPLGRFGRPEEIAGAVVFLASPAGGFVTGQILSVDGGQLLRGMEGTEKVFAHLQG